MSDNIRIPLPERDALRLLGKVKPTAEMPRPGATKSAKGSKAGLPEDWPKNAPPLSIHRPNTSDTKLKKKMSAKSTKYKSSKSPRR